MANFPFSPEKRITNTVKGIQDFQDSVLSESQPLIQPLASSRLSGALVCAVGQELVMMCCLPVPCSHSNQYPRPFVDTFSGTGVLVVRPAGSETRGETLDSW
jgi:hypothetical protein